MKDIISHYSIVILIVMCLNVALTAVKTILEKIEASTPEVEGPDSKIVKAETLIAKINGWLKTFIDWVSANKEH